MRVMSLGQTFNLAILIFSIFIISVQTQKNETNITVARTNNQNQTKKVNQNVIKPFLEENIRIKDGMELFFEWHNDALKKHDPDSYLAYLATVNKEGYPSLRPLALYYIDEDGFLFFTSHKSRKASDIASNPNVAMTLFWKTLQRVVRIEGVAEKLTEEESMPFFLKKTRAQQVRILAGEQSARVPSRMYLKELEANVTASLEPNQTVPFPDWGGYIIMPRSIEFWQAQSDFVNDRIRFRRGEGVEKEVDGVLVHMGEDGWVYERLGP